MIKKTFYALSDALTHYHSFKTTRAELARLSHRELEDIGLNPYDVTGIALSLADNEIAQRRKMRAQNSDAAREVNIITA